jgi:hypothetical protein
MDACARQCSDDSLRVKFILSSVLCFIMVLMVSCGVASGGLDARTLRDMPEVRTLDRLQRRASSTDSQTGDEAVATGGDVLIELGTAKLTSTPGSLTWAIYAFPAGGTLSLDTASAQLSAVSGTAWMAIANFASDGWEISEVGADGTFEPRDTSAGTYTSPGGFVYLAVLAFDGAQMTVDAVAYDVPVAAGVQWSTSYGEPSADYFYESAVWSANDALFIAGEATTDGDNSVGVLSRYDRTGARLWSKTIDGPSPNESLSAIVELPDGDLIAALLDLRFQQGEQPVLVRLHADGSVVWAYAYGDPGTGSASKLALGPQYVYTTVNDIDNSTAYVLAIDYNGNVAWARSMDSGTYGPLFKTAYSDGCIYVPGNVLTGAGNWLVGLNANTGKQLFSRDWLVGDEFTLQGTQQIESDGHGGAYCVTVVDHNDGNITNHVLDFDATGEVQQQFALNQSGLQYAGPAAMAVDGHGVLYLANLGESRITRVSADGTVLSDQSAYRQDTSDYGNYYIGDIALGPGGNLFVAGYTHTAPTPLALSDVTPDTEASSITPTSEPVPFSAASATPLAVTVISSDASGSDTYTAGKIRAHLWLTDY